MLVQLDDILPETRSIEQIEVSFSSVSPNIDHEFRHNIVKVVASHADIL